VRIGIDGSCWSNRRGFGRFTRGLVTEMARRADGDACVLLLDSVSAADPSLPDVPSQLEVAVAPVRDAPATSAAAAGARRLGDVLRMGRAARRLGCDVFFFPATYSYFPVGTVPVVVTVHDAIAEQLPHLTLPSVGDRVRWRLKQRSALLEARAVLTVSNASQRAIVEALRVRDDRLHVIREAPDELFRHQPAGARRGPLAELGLPEDDPFVLYVGGISPHKNLGVLLRAFELVAPEVPHLRLVLVGDADDDPFLSSASSVRAAVDASPVRDRICLTGYVRDEQLVALYSAALGTALPSLGEGFGLTAAESAACGTPVVASRDPALVELLGDAGLYAPADDAVGFAEHFRRLATDPALRAAASAAVGERAATWSWAGAADRTLELLRKVAARGG